MFGLTARNTLSAVNAEFFPLTAFFDHCFAARCHRRGRSFRPGQEPAAVQACGEAVMAHLPVAILLSPVGGGLPCIP